LLSEATPPTRKTRTPLRQELEQTYIPASYAKTKKKCWECLPLIRNSGGRRCTIKERNVKSRKDFDEAVILFSGVAGAVGKKMQKDMIVGGHDKRIRRKTAAASARAHIHRKIKEHSAKL